MLHSKKGVSLITVLLFMLVATIAATATFKWLTSENRSSAARLQRQEAYQTALAGIDDARAWMSNHANDVGGIVKQFFDGQKPVSLNSVLHPLNRDGQSNSVWLTAVDTMNANIIKLKLISKGVSRNGTSHTEAAILNVSGLYRVKVPQEDLSITFNKAFHGGSEGITGTDTIGSGNINGDWAYSNNPVVKGDMIVTGSTKYGGTVYHYGDFYLAKNLETDGDVTYGTEGIDTSVIYIGGNVTCPDGRPINVFGDLYVNGNISDKCKVHVKGNFTLGGRMVKKMHYQDPYYGTSTPVDSADVYVYKNWVFTKKVEEQLELQHDNAYNQTSFYVGKNLYLPYKMKAHCSDKDIFNENRADCGDKDGKRIFSVGGNVFQYNNSQFEVNVFENNTNYKYGVYMDGYTRSTFANNEEYCKEDTEKCKRGRIFSFEAAGISTQRVTEWKSTDNVLKNIGDNYWPNIEKMNLYGKMIKKDNPGPEPGRIPQPIVTKNEGDWKKAKANEICGIENSFEFTNDVVQKLNTCYSEKKSILYNDYLIIEWNDPFGINSVNEALDGKFVFYAPKAVGQTILPPTASGSIVMLYLEKGTLEGASGQLQGRKGGDGDSYLIFSKEDIGEIWQLHIKGSVVMADKKKLQKYQGGCNLEFDGDVLKSLISAGIIKENPEYTKLVLGEEVNEDGLIAGPTVYDDYYIATSPQLGISLESQYETKEKVEESGNDAPAAIAPSAIVLPRVIYLTKDPVGKLSDYYSVVYLNGAKDANPPEVTCNPALNTTTKLYTNDNLLTKGIYNCKCNSQTYGDLPFYVVVSGETGKTPTVSLNAPTAEISNDGTVIVSATVGEATNPQPVQVDISVSKAPEGWTVTPNVQTVIRSESSSETVYTLTLTPNTNVNLFTVTTDASARQGSVYFHLMPPLNGCTIAAPSSERVIMTGYVTVQRGSISQYCSKTENQTLCLEKPFNEIVRAPDCDDLVSGEWIRASGTNVSVIDENNKWNVGVNTSISLKAQNSGIPNYCELVLPTENNTITNTVENSEYWLYASLKRKQYKLTVKTKDIENEGTHVSVYYKTGGSEYTDITSNIDFCKNNSEGDLDCYVYAGWTVKADYTIEGNDKLSRWECEGDNCPVPAMRSLEFVLPQITANNTLTAVFNDKDDHCFYEDFTELTAFCSGGTTNCINTCEGGNGSSCTVSGANADWQLMYPNNGNGANIAPVIQNGYIRSGSDMLNESSTIILSTKEAGIHGSMTTMIQTTVLENNTKSLNSGFIFSSDATASSYTLLNIYGNASKGKALTARVCKGSASGNSVINENCTNTTFKTASSGTISMDAESMIKLKIDLTLENQLLIIATVDGYTASAEMDISTYLGSRDEHARYVGFDISDPSFKIYDIGWSSYYFIEECFDNPRINCSFAANYIGGIVPKNKDVSPWVGVSSWYEEHNCTVSYYYNGCDNSTGNSSTGCVGHQFNKDWFKSWREEYDIDGNYFGAQLSDSIYNFSEKGEHGSIQTYSYNTFGRPITMNRAINDAKVKITCADHQTSLDGTWSSCGTFWVGEITGCSQNAEILNSLYPEYATADQEIEIPVNDHDGIVNLRSSTLWIDISDFTESENDKINLYLKDENGVLSLPREINTNGTQSFDVNDMANVESFNPQAVKSVVLKSSLYPYQVNSIVSSCPNALGIRNCNATYNGISWKLTSTITNIEGAAANGCSVFDGNTAKMENVSCPSDGFFTFKEDEDLYNLANSTGNDIERSFVIKAKSNDGGEVSCVTEPVAISPVTVSCSIEDDKTVVETGEGMPTLNFTLTGCPSGGCEYTARVADKETVSGTITSKGVWTPTVNELPALPLGTYTYYISVFGGEAKECGTVTVANANAAEVTNCQLESNNPKEKNYKFSADVTPATDGSEWKIQVVVFDPLGKEVKREPKDPKKGKKKDHFEHPIPGHDIAAGYSAQLYLNGVAVPGCHLPFDKEPVSSSSSAAMSSAEDDVSSSSEVMSSSAVAPRVTCPSAITSQYPEDKISVENATIENCSGSDCRIDILYGRERKNENNELYFYHLSGTGTMTYTLKATKDGQSHQCTFDVTFVPRIDITCPSDVSNQDPASPVSVTNASVRNCNPCSYRVLDEYETEQGKSNNLNFTFNPPGAGTTGDKYYTFEASDNKGHVGTCSFKVTYARPNVVVACPTATVSNQNPNNVSVNISVSNCDDCEYRIGNITPTKDGRRFTFSDEGASGTKKYTFTATDPNEYGREASCEFDVEFASCTNSDWIIDQYNNNKMITFNPKANDGCYHLNTQKSCHKVQVEETTGSGLIEINGSKFNCGYVAGTSITAKSVMELTVPSTCSVGKLYVYECN